MTTRNEEELRRAIVSLAGSAEKVAIAMDYIVDMLEKEKVKQEQWKPENYDKYGRDDDQT